MSELRSARGLFAATGKIALPIERIPQDFYATPAEVTRALLRVEGDRLDSFPVIWEPAAGTGAIVEVLKRNHSVVFSDIADRGYPHVRVQSFFDYRAPPALAIVTNPPFSEVNWRDGKGRWITHALDVLDIEYMALLLPWTWPAAAGLGEIWEKHPPAIVYLMRWRIDWTEQGAPPSSHAWFIYDRGHRGETILRMLDREPKQGKLL
jgi:hypothetical protein